MMEEHPAFVRLYDLLFDGEDDLRQLSLRIGARGLMHGSSGYGRGCQT